jgi:hypothetical protein
MSFDATSVGKGVYRKSKKSKKSRKYKKYKKYK